VVYLLFYPTIDILSTPFCCFLCQIRVG